MNKNKRWSALKGPWKGEGIAIIGMAGRFPQAQSVDEFWQNLCDGRDCITRLSEDELLKDGVDPAIFDNERFVPAGGVLDDIELFDASFFGISPREAESMDPQQRLFLEVVQHAFDDAGVDPARAPGSISVYAGCRLSGYWLRLMKIPGFMNTLGWHQVAAGNDKDFLPLQASFRFNLRGPSINVQAACSTSMLAVSLGCDALIARQCHIAVAGAASIAVPQRTGYVYQPGSIASPDGRCRPFDAAANGAVLGNAVGAVVLKRVDDAIAAGDRIYAVIRSIAVNNDGSTKSSFAAPSVKAQAEVIACAIERAGISPAEIDYVEAHGTATKLGDPIEAAALARVFANGPPRSMPCGIGSVKSNVGHLDPVAGVASLIKVALCLHQGEIPATIHFEQPNPSIDFQAAGLRVVSKKEAWPRRGTPRYAGVSCFGIGGTNVHALLSEAPVREETASRHTHQLLIISAKSSEALRTLEIETATHLRGSREVPLASFAYTLACGRSELRYRRSIVATSCEEAAVLLEKDGQDTAPIFLKDRQVVFLFPGQGGQYLHMGRDLYRNESIFAAAADEVFGLAEAYIGFNARTLIDSNADSTGTEHDITQTVLAQPLLFAVEYAAARLWMHWGVRPQQMLGHSIGELVAAHISGVMSLPDAVRVVCERGRLMQQMEPGAMIAVSLNELDSSALEDEHICIAAFNAPKQHSLSGSIEAIDSLERTLRQRGVEYSRLDTSHAFHHPSMTLAADRLLETLNRIELKTPNVPFISCVTGELISTEQATSPAYWAQSIIAPVRFSQGVRRLLDIPNPVFIECGAGRALGSLVRAHSPNAGSVIVGTMSSRGDSRNDRACALEGLGAVWQSGAAIDWDSFWSNDRRQRVKLPSYPFQRERYWVDAPQEVPVQAAGGFVRRNLADNCFTRTWVSTPLDGPIPAALSGTWLILCDAGWLGQALCNRLRQAGAKTIAVFAGANFQAISEQVFGVDPRSLQDAKQLIEQAAIEPGEVHLLNCWTSAIPSGALTVERGELGALLSLFAPVRFLQTLLNSGRAATSVHTVTSRLFAITPGEVPEPVVAPAIGLTRVLPQELTGVRVSLIDVAVPANAFEAQTLIEQITTELLSDTSDSIVAYRNGKRLCESFMPVAAPPPVLAFDRLRGGGTYLITGGFGGIGGVLAKALAQAGKAQIVLVGRHGLSEAGSNSAQAAAAHQLVRDLEQMGATVLPLTADISDPTQVASVFKDVESRFGRIRGVIHAAGIPGGRMLMVPDQDSAQAVLAPKLQGTIALLNHVVPHQPDFIILCSSFAAVSGGVGQGDYAAGNAFIDAAAWFARAHGMRATAINWPAWRDVGMAHSMVLPAELEYMRQASLSTGIAPGEGVELFARILGTDLPQVIVPPFAPVDAARSAATPMSASGMAKPVAVTRSPSDRHEPVQPVMPKPMPMKASGSIGSATTDPIDEILVARLGGIWSAVLGVREVRPSDNFFELGGQSLMALQIVSQVTEQLPVELNFSDIFEHPTLEQFASVVYQRLVDEIAAMPDATIRTLLN